MRRSSALANDAAIIGWTGDLERGDISLIEFLQCVSRSIINVFDSLLGDRNDNANE